MSPSALLGCDNFSGFPCFWWPWQFWGGLARCFVDCPSVGICLLFCLWLDWARAFWEGRPQRCSTIFITSYRGYLLSVWLTLVDIDFGHLAEVVFARCLQPSFVPCPPSILSSWNEVTMQPWILLLEDWKLHPFRAEYQHKLFGILLHGRFVPSPLFIYSIICLYQHGLMNIYALDVEHAMLLSSFHCPNCSIFGPSFCVHIDISTSPCIFKVLLYFVADCSSSCIFPAPALESAFSPRCPGSFYWKMVLETKIWVHVVNFNHHDSCNIISPS